MTRRRLDEPSVESNGIGARIDTDPDGIRICTFDEHTASSLQSSLTNAIRNEQSLYIIEIDSYGGEAYSLMSMIDIVERAKRSITVVTYCSGKAMSCGAVLLAAGSDGYRFAGEYSTVMVHKVSSGHVGKVDELKINYKETERINTIIINLLSKYTKKNRTYIDSLLSSKDGADVYLTAVQAKKHGLVDKLGVPIHLRTMNHLLSV